MLLALLLAAAAPLEPAATASPTELGPRPGTSKGDRAVYWRLVAEIGYENCVRTNALAIARLDSEPATLAKAAVAFCHEEELLLWSRTVGECRDTGQGDREGNRGGVCADRLTAKWRDVAEQEAFGCIAGTRFKPAAIGVSICKMSDLSMARALTAR